MRRKALEIVQGGDGHLFFDPAKFFLKIWRFPPGCHPAAYPAEQRNSWGWRQGVAERFQDHTRIGHARGNAKKIVFGESFGRNEMGEAELGKLPHAKAHVARRIGHVSVFTAKKTIALPSQAAASWIGFD